MIDLKDWLPDTFSSVDRTPDRRLSGIRLPLSEQDHRRFAARSIEPMSPGGYYVLQNTVRTLKNWTTKRSRLVVEKIDAVSAWENEGGR